MFYSIEIKVKLEDATSIFWTFRVKNVFLRNVIIFSLQSPAGSRWSCCNSCSAEFCLFCVGLYKFHRLLSKFKLSVFILHLTLHFNLNFSKIIVDTTICRIINSKPWHNLPSLVLNLINMQGWGQYLRYFSYKYFQLNVPIIKCFGNASLY